MLGANAGATTKTFLSAAGEYTLMAERYLFQNVDAVYYEHPRRHQHAEMLALGFAGFLLPMLLGHPQLLVGVAVNAFIIRAALALPQNKALPVLLTPSLGALARGLLFGPFTVFLIYLIPFIWAGNYILFLAFKTKLAGNLNYGLALAGGSLAKAGFLYLTAYALYSAHIIPAIFLTAMGAIQLTTALLGGIVVYLQLKAEKRFIG